jgi:hypothetical protein
MNDEQETNADMTPIGELERRIFGPLTPEQRERVLEALHTVEQAQRLLADAGELLCPIPHLESQWESIRGIYFQVRDCRHAIDNKLPFLTS